MASRLSLDDKLAALRAMRNQPPSATDASELRPFVRDRSNLVVATAAALVAERSLLELAADLEAAFDRFLIDPLKNDKLCRAKIAVVETLEKMEHLKRGVFEKAARHVQLEPVFGGKEDTAARLRDRTLCARADRRVGLSLPAG